MILGRRDDEIERQRADTRSHRTPRLSDRNRFPDGTLIKRFDNQQVNVVTTCLVHATIIAPGQIICADIAGTSKSICRRALSAESGRRI